tara:strand:+ start:1661 stop:1792 length:132 start_codon:yes stop_codon:yes gene_type:complete
MDRKDERRDRFLRKKKHNKIDSSSKLKSLKRRENKTKTKEEML